MKITQSMVDLMKSFSIVAMRKDSIGELRGLYHDGIVAMGNLSKQETITPEQACSITEFFIDTIRNAEARIENN